MNRTTIDFGIDLGTTNSSIAVLEGTKTRVFKNNDGQEITPSAVWIDKKGRSFVGQQAKEQLGFRDEDTKSEFKLRMGSSQLYRFASSGRQMTPEELSAEVLKSLRADVKKSMGEEVAAAAITVPASFAQPQCEATNKAAQLAGLSFTPLLQEPVAAGLAYGFQSKSDRVFWMVFDFGGGTFDAAIIQVREGMITVVNHEGDNHLGGKLIDWEIVEQLLVPALQQEYAFPDFRGDNPKWKTAFAKLKRSAEEAKIRLSKNTITPITIDPLCLDDHGMPIRDEQGKPIRFEHELHRSDIEPVVEPFVERTINMCRKVLGDKRLSPVDIEKIILVGGPTLTPILRDMLSDKLGIPLEFSVDPLTVVACGAAIFAGTQRIPEDIMPPPPVRAGQYKVELDYEPIGNEIDPQVGGRIISPEGGSLAGFSIEFVEAKSQWRSGKIDIGAEGTFRAFVLAEKGRKNEFLIELKDGAGNLRETVPDRFAYTIGITADRQPVINSFGVALANNEMEIFLRKGTPLPSRCRKVLHTTTSVKRGDSATFVRIPVVEGENTRRADRNRLIGALTVSGDKIRRDLPAGSEVEVTLEMDESRVLQTKAYIPILDEEYPEVIKTEIIDADRKHIAEDFEHTKVRLEEAREKAEEIGLPEVKQPLQRVQDEHMMHDIETALDAPEADVDAPARCQSRLLELKSAIDEVEDTLEWPTLVSGAEEGIEEARKIVDEYGDSDDHRSFDSLESEIKKAIASHDADLLHRMMDGLQSLVGGLLRQQPAFWVGYLNYLAEEKKSYMKNQALAERLIAQGRRAIDANDLNELTTVVRQLIDLLPQAVQQEARGFVSTVISYRSGGGGIE